MSRAATFNSTTAAVPLAPLGALLELGAELRGGGGTVAVLARRLGRATI